MDQLVEIAHVRSAFPEKFGIPRQSNLVPGLRARVVFAPAYRNPEALQGLEAFSHLWLVWGFSGAERDGWSPTVRPPRLGGNKRVGVFASRSPFRPNPIGLSSVRLDRVEPATPEGPVLHILGADMMDGTPVYDIKPYLPYADCHPDAAGGYAPGAPGPVLEVEIGEELLQRLPEEAREALPGVLALDPRPSYQDDPERVYGMAYAGFQVRFTVSGGKLRVVEIGG